MRQIKLSTVQILDYIRLLFYFLKYEPLNYKRL
jgi:hypothetical protein